MERPRRVAVNEQQRQLAGVAVAFVEVVKPASANVEPVRRERIERPPRGGDILLHRGIDGGGHPAIMPDFAGL
jgi:hypothetical protein